MTDQRRQLALDTALGARRSGCIAELLVDELPDALAALACDASVLFLSRAAAALLGCDPDQAVGRGLQELLALEAEARDSLGVALQRATGGEPTALELPARAGGVLTLRLQLASQGAGTEPWILAWLGDCVEPAADAPSRASETRLRGAPGRASEAHASTAEESWFVSDARRELLAESRPDRKLRELLESAPDAMIIVDQEGRIQLINAQTEKLFGYCRAELIGEPIELLVPSRLQPRHRAHRQRFFREPELRAMDSDLTLLGRRKDGSEFPVEIGLSPIEGEDGTYVASAIRDVTERTKIDDARARLAAIVDSSADAIVSKSLDGIIHSWNEGATRLFGYTAEEVIGKPISLLVPPGRRDEESRILERIKRGERVEPFESVRRRKDGSEIDVSITMSPVRDAAGEVIGASKVARDITRRKRSEQALARAKDAAELANRELEAFSYSVAHDLRTPLRSMAGFSQILLEDYEEKLDDDGKRHLHRVRESAQYMAQLIDSLLSLARVTQSPVRSEVVNLSALAKTAAARLHRAQPERAVELIVADGKSAIGDPALLAIVFDNLLGNAWKFTAHREKARIEFGSSEEGGRPVFFVRDNGAGFDMAYSEKLFGVFQRLHGAREFEGTGIGLATIERIVRRHGGRVWAHGAVDQGAIFYFTLNEKERPS